MDAQTGRQLDTETELLVLLATGREGGGLLYPETKQQNVAYLPASSLSPLVGVPSVS